MPDTADLIGVTLDCADPKAMVAFYHELTGMEITYSEEEYGGLAGGGGMAVNFQRVEGYRAPEWPGQDVPQQFHLDFAVADLDAAEARAVGLGATRPDFQPGATWRVLLDPAGHPFCLTQKVSD